MRWQITVRCMLFFYLCKLNQIYMYARRNKTTKKTNSHESLHLGLTGFNTLKWLAYSTISDEKDDQMPSLGRRWVALTMAMVRASRWALLSILLALASPMAWLGRRGVVGVMIFPLPVPRFTRSCLFLQHTKFAYRNVAMYTLCWSIFWIIIDVNENFYPAAVTFQWISFTSPHQLQLRGNGRCASTTTSTTAESV